jgi:hypothetical protein
VTIDRSRRRDLSSGRGLLFLSALFCRDGEKSRSLLLNLFALAVRARDTALLILRKRQDPVEGLMALFADVFVAWHGNKFLLVSKKGVLYQTSEL